MYDLLYSVILTSFLSFWLFGLFVCSLYLVAYKFFFCLVVPVINCFTTFQDPFFEYVLPLNISCCFSSMMFTVLFLHSVFISPFLTCFTLKTLHPLQRQPICTMLILCWAFLDSSLISEPYTNIFCTMPCA